jgi:hypothetical protein
MNGYQLTRQWFEWRFNNPGKLSSAHAEFYFYIVDRWNYFGQKSEFGLPRMHTMEVLSIGSRNTYKKIFNDLIEHGFIKLIRESCNQYHHASIIALSKFEQALDTPLDTPTEQAPEQAPDPIVKPNNQQTNKPIKTEQEFKEGLKQYEPKYGLPMIMAFFNYWTETDQKGKMRFEAQKFFDISKRLATWHSKNKFSSNTFVPLAAQANQNYYPPKPEHDPILLRQEVHSNYGDYVRHCLKVGHPPEKPKYPELVPADFDHIAFINQIKSAL